MKTKLQGIARKAKEDSEYRFKNLYTMLNKEMLQEAYKRINKKAQPGVDGVTAQDYERNLEDNIKDLLKRLKEKRYRASYIKRVEIPKGGGQTRSLGLPCIEDRILQMACSIILTEIYEQDFLECSYGYRPGKSAHDAVFRLSEELTRGEYTCVIDADIKGYFDNINHEWIEKMLLERVNDRAFIKLIKKWLKIGIKDTKGNTIRPEKGTPQGGVISPLLANIYLHYILDLWFIKVVRKYSTGEACIYRYADDIVFAFENQSDAAKFMNSLKKRLRKFGLKLSEEKTRKIIFGRKFKSIDSSFDFLGFEFRWRTSRNGKRYVAKQTSSKRLKRSIETFKEWGRTMLSERTGKIFQRLNVKLRGYFNYFGITGNYRRLMKFYRILKWELFKVIRQKSRKQRYYQWMFRKHVKIFRLEKPRIVHSVYGYRQKEFSFT